MNIGFLKLTNLVQEYISENHSSLLIEDENLTQLKSYIEKFIMDNDYTVKGYDDTQTINKLYSEMVEYSIITEYLKRKDLEEININAWNDIVITYRDGHLEKLESAFQSPEHAIDIVSRLLRHSGMTIDPAKPKAEGHLKFNARITAIISPIVDSDVAVSASIRFLHNNNITKRTLVDTGLATMEMIEFLQYCLKYGTSVVISGITSSGKTTLLNCLAEDFPTDKRIYTIESGARELDLVKKDENGKIINNVVHTLSKLSDHKEYSITQEDLVVTSLRFNPDLDIIGEMRDTEAYSAVEQSLTGHTIATTVHARGGASAHMRIALLCQKRFPIDFNTTLLQVAEAFPVVVHIHRMLNNERKILSISECVVDENANRHFNTLYRYNVTDNYTNEDGKIKIEGDFEKVNPISVDMVERMKHYGISNEELSNFYEEDNNI